LEPASPISNRGILSGARGAWDVPPHAVSASEAMIKRFLSIFIRINGLSYFFQYKYSGFSWKLGPSLK
jgi:hypothetical protein